MPLNQRKVIAEAIDGKRYVEWGVGGTTVWLAQNSSPKWGRSIEHDADWFGLLYSEFVVAGKIGCDWKVRPAPCTPGQNATIGEEQADDADDYVQAGFRADADVYLIDGVVRGDCLRALVATGRPMTVFIHDTQRDWYDDAIAKAIDAGFTRTDYPEGEDYPGCLLTKLEKK
jgi:hypothetical protein